MIIYIKLCFLRLFKQRDLNETYEKKNKVRREKISHSRLNQNFSSWFGCEHIQSQLALIGLNNQNL